MAISLERTREIVGIIGNVISLLLFLSPLPTIYQILQEKSAQGYKPDPYVAGLLSCAMWVLYGMPFIHPDSILILTINAVGFFIELSYLVVFLLYSDWPKRRKILIGLFTETVFVIVVVIVAMVCLHTITMRSMLVGILAIVFSVLMYVAPLTIMSKVIRTKSVKYMPFCLSFANFLNGACWSAYSLIKLDPYVLIPNSLGCLSGLLQLILYACFYKTTNWDEDGSPSENGSIEIPPIPKRPDV